MSLFTGLIGIIDILSAGALLSTYFGHPLPHLQAGMALALLGKGLFFITDVLSWIDIIIAVCMFIFFWVEAPTVALVMATWLLYKGLYAWL